MNKRVVNLIFGVSLVVLLLLSVFAYHRVSTFKEYSSIVDRSNRILLALSNLRSGYNTIIAEQRSYLITKNVDYYDRFLAEKDSLRETFRQYKRLTKGNVIHQTYGDKLQKVADNRIQSLMVEIINDSSSARYKYVQNELIKKNEEINKKFIKLLDNIDAHEESVLNKQLRIKEFEEQFTPFVLFIMALAALGIITYSFFMVVNELEARDFANELLEENVENLNRSNRELEQYAYVASHDLQEPLRKIRMFSDRLIIQYKDKLEPDAQEMLMRMNASSERMTHLINDLLGLSRLLSEKPETQEVDLQEVVKDTIKEFEDKIEACKAEIEVGFLPEISGYKGQLLQLFQNLIGNALKFRKDGVTPVIRIKSSLVTKYKGEAPIQYHHIVIKDNGIGFDNQFKKKMFTIFGRLEKTTGIDGTGIGLNICLRIMENHGGEIDAEGEVNVGASFHLYFPV
jgi:signal transduction histidine kinase